MKNTIKEIIENHPVINTHSHHLPDKEFGHLKLDYLFRQSYVNWNGVLPGDTYEERANFLKKNRHSSYFVWLQKAIQDLYDLDEPISASNWDEVSEAIENANKNPEYHLNLLAKKCSYRNVILDAFWDPGSNNGHGEIFSPTYRINNFLFAYSPEAEDHNGNSPKKLFGYELNDLDGYIDFIREEIKGKKQEGCIALKSALAYDRPLDFRKVSRDNAYKALKTLNSNRGKGNTLIGFRDLPSRDTQTTSYDNAQDSLGDYQREIRDFQDYVFFKICEIAAEEKLPIQCHTGMGLLEGTRAMDMREVIENNPNTKFVLFHCSYPWVDDINGLLRKYENVYPDLCWLPLLSTSAAVRTLHELIEGGTSDRISWGCDTWTSEESYGALMAFKFVLNKVLESKIDHAYLSIDDAAFIIDNIMYNNAANLYGIS